MEELINNLKFILEQDEMFSLGAKLAKKSVDALVVEGFSREEAIKIVAVQGSLVKNNG